MKRVDGIDRKLLWLIQDDLPVEKRPFDAWAQTLGIEPGELISRLELLRRQGVIRSVKAILRHRQTGFSSGAMVVWAVPGDQVDRIGRELACRREVSHCYERPGFGEYNLFSMIHGRTDDEVLRVIGEISSELGIDRYRVYWSLRELKKSSMNYFREGGGEES
ncbi:MAG: Lrp/AsnC family transcriptional regulator [Desulfomonilia bacterium]|uniref:siroheme decarboxylase n=1 Tax=anaerobic digester metagenome TaxID=1263854 RepID=A0A485M6T9_9ZZZZ|nr:Lrp/AsnC family transcriptional regulator [Pseudomonadota bacterium]HON38451.1 Lrp/AsnC family transcriptional regulator [Deltaproteobacteria bacterium]HRS54863.1 Lrp/AsnC family transcriptional regulator [Desulfomonilia bacterium]HPD20165.1 Lrp/AsnC family transcriptional regulator [Deltaproteobacteria bacterium]HPX17951.1 Lrp/AsnC family transcriptional regulator [Deltaproteobacteria bacterium]